MNASTWRTQVEKTRRAGIATVIPALFGMVCASHAFQGDDDRIREFRYAITEVPGLGGDFDEPVGINDLGHIVGNSVPASGRFLHPFFWDGSETIDLGTFGGTRGFAHDINNLNWVVGAAFYQGDTGSAAFLWKNGGELIDLGNFGKQSGTARAINEQNQIVGSAGVEPGVFQAFLWENGEIRNLGSLVESRSSQAWDINEMGYITGWTLAPGASNASFLWDPNTEEMSLIGSLGDELARNEASGMNDDNVIVGGAAVGRSRHLGARPYIFNDGEMYNLQKIYFVDKGFVGGWSLDVNNAGQVVGFIGRRNESNSFGFIFELGEGMRVLDDLLPPHTTWHVSGGRAINEHGQIAALARPKGSLDFFRALLLTPVEPELMLETEDGPLRAGEINRLTITGATPGAMITFVYGKDGGGARIDGCADLDAILQINNPITIGTAIADANGVATLETFIDPRAEILKGRLLQAYDAGHCMESQLIQKRIE